MILNSFIFFGDIVPEYMTVYECVKTFFIIKDFSNVETCVNDFFSREEEIRERKDSKILELSKGWKNIVYNSLMDAFTSWNKNVDLFILDEPFEGLDFERRNSLSKKINKLKSEGHTIIIVDHNFNDLKGGFADYFTVINDGLIIYDGNDFDEAFNKSFGYINEEEENNNQKIG